MTPSSQSTLKELLTQIIKDINIGDNQWVAKYGNNTAVDQIISAIQARLPEYAKKNEGFYDDTANVDGFNRCLDKIYELLGEKEESLNKEESPQLPEKISEGATHFLINREHGLNVPPIIIEKINAIISYLEKKHG